MSKMEESEARRPVAMYLKQFQAFLFEVKKMNIECDVSLIYDEFMNHTLKIKGSISSSLEAKLSSLDVEIEKISNKTKGKYIKLEDYEAKTCNLKIKKEERHEIQCQLEENSKKLKIIIKDIEMISMIKQWRKGPTNSGIHLVGIEVLKEFTRISNALPIYAKRSAIVELVNNNQFIVLKGETGSGKSTQLAQYVMEGIIQSGNRKVICTQPRKVAAISLARRIADEQFQQVGGLIGYWIGMNKCCNEKTRLLLMTDQMLLKHCLENPQLNGISCVIIDEAHERSINIDLLLGMVKAAAKFNKDLKVIVTSATISTSLFSDYFYRCRIIQIPGRMYPVEVEYDEKEDDDYSKRAVSKALEIHREKGPGDILIFLTTPIEVDKAVEAFAKASINMKKCVVLPLHGKLQPDQQMRVFQTVESGKRKIVFSTNVAETSVTIPGIKFVIDCGMVKEKLYDAKKGISYLQVKMVSKSSAIQRMGRAGRTGPGICFRLYTKAAYDTLEEATLPEIKRMHLGSAVLRLMALGISDVKSFDFIEKPDEANLTNSIAVLKMLGAIDDNCNITAKGRELAKLPLEPRAAKIVLDGIEGGCREEAVGLAAAMVYSSSVFFRPGGDEGKKSSDEAKVQFCNKDGDLISLLEIYQDWKKQTGTKAKNKWCSERYLNAKTMRSLNELIDDINSSLKEITTSNSEKDVKSYEEKQVYLKELLISTHYDNIAVFSGHERIGYWSQKLREHFLIHPSSVLCILAMQPEFIVFQDVLKTSANFITGITPIEKETVTSLCPMKQFAINFWDVEERKVTEMKIFPVGPLVVKSLIGKGGERRKEIEAEINDMGRVPGLVEMSIEERKICIYTTRGRQSMARALLSDRIREEMRKLDKEVKEEEFGKVKTGYRVLMKAGGAIEEILEKSESLHLVVKIGKKYVDERIEDEMLKNISCEISTKIKEFEGINDIRKEEKDMQKSVQWGQITFSKLAELENAKAKLTFTFKDYQVQAYTINKEAVNQSKSHVKVKVRWSRRSSRGLGFIKCTSKDAVEEILPIIRMKYRARNDRNDTAKIFVSNIDRDLTSEDFRRSIEEEVDSVENITHASIMYEKANDCDLKEEERGYELTLKAILHDTPFESIVTFRIKNELSVTCSAVINCKRFEDAEKAVFHLNGTNIIGKQNCSASIVLRREFFCKVVIFDKIKAELDDIIRQTNKSTTEISILNSKSGDFKVIKISGEDSFTYKATYARLQDLLAGEIIEELTISPISYNLMMQQIANMEREIPHGKIEYDKKGQKFITYGNPEVRKLLQDRVKQMHERMCWKNEIIIKLKGRGKAPGLMKQLMKTYGPRLQGMMSSKDHGILELNIRSQVISVKAATDVITDINKHVDEHNQLLLDTNFVSGHQDEVQDDMCPLCLCKTEEPSFILQSCGHAYCDECLKQYIESSIVNKNFPIRCCEENCGKYLVLKDFGLLIKNKSEKDALMEAGIDQFVMKNPRCYKYCPSPNCCMVYRVSDEQMAKVFKCPSCSKETCTACHGNGHKEFQSCAAWRAYNNDGHLFAWAQNKDCRKCPECGLMIEKNGGCMHMACKCGAHICWGCMRVFSSGGKCYDHQGECSRKPPSQTHMQVQTEWERGPRAATPQHDGVHHRPADQPSVRPRAGSSTHQPEGIHSTTVDQSSVRPRVGTAPCQLEVIHSTTVDQPSVRPRVGTAPRQLQGIHSTTVNQSSVRPRVGTAPCQLEVIHSTTVDQPSVRPRVGTAPRQLQGIHSTTVDQSSVRPRVGTAPRQLQGSYSTTAHQPSSRTIVGVAPRQLQGIHSTTVDQSSARTPAGSATHHLESSTTAHHSSLETRVSAAPRQPEGYHSGTVNQPSVRPRAGAAIHQQDDSYFRIGRQQGYSTAYPIHFEENYSSIYAFQRLVHKERLSPKPNKNKEKCTIL